MPKRTAEEQIEHYNRKIRRLQDKVKRRSRRRVINSDSEDENNQESNQTYDYTNEAQIYEEYGSEVAPHCDNNLTAGPPEDLLTEPLAELPLQSAAGPSSEPAAEPLAGPSSEPNAEPLAETSTTVTPDPAMLAALGDPTDESPDYGPKIQESLANLWLPLLKKETPKNKKDKLIEGYLVPDNCRLFQAPKLNIEISATAISDMVRNRDKKLMQFQQQLGCGLTAINRGMDILLTKGDPADAMAHLSNSCRILSDFHALFTQYRIKLITPSLDKSFLNVIQDTERDETLFGNTLGEKIKASSTIQRQGLQIKKTMPNPKAGPSTAGRPNQGNWSGPPPRYYQPAHRGGRGGPRRAMMSVVRRPYQYPPPQAAPPPPPRFPGSSRPRAPFNQ